MLGNMELELAALHGSLSLGSRLTRQFNVAQLLCKLNDYNKIARLFQDVVSKSAEGGGEHDWCSAGSLYRLAYSHYALGDLPSALRQACGARSMSADYYGEEDDHTVNAQDLVHEIEREMWK